MKTVYALAFATAPKDVLGYFEDAPTAERSIVISWGAFRPTVSRTSTGFHLTYQEGQREVEEDLIFNPIYIRDVPEHL